MGPTLYPSHVGNHREFKKENDRPCLEVSFLHRKCVGCFYPIHCAPPRAESRSALRLEDVYSISTEQCLFQPSSVASFFCLFFFSCIFSYNLWSYLKAPL